MINVKVGEQKTQSEKPFPKLMISKSDRIVYFIKENCGFQLDNYAVSQDPNNRVPHYDEDWDMGSFTDFNESITLQNA